MLIEHPVKYRDGRFAHHSPLLRREDIVLEMPGSGEGLRAIEFGKRGRLRRRHAQIKNTYLRQEDSDTAVLAVSGSRPAVTIGDGSSTSGSAGGTSEPEAASRVRT